MDFLISSSNDENIEVVCACAGRCSGCLGGCAGCSGCMGSK